MGAAKKLGFNDANDASLLRQGDPITTIVYGPMETRRFGASLGLNLLGAEKICSFDCPYCSLGPTKARLNRLKNQSNLPSQSEILDAVVNAFKVIHTSGPSIDTICISGNGEPTLHPDFAEIARAVIAARDAWMPTKKIVCLTNGAGLDLKKTIESLNLLDERIVKIDAGNERIFKAMGAPLSRANLSKVLLGARGLADFTAQSMFIQGAVDNTSPSDVDDWIEVIAMLKPKAVQIQGLDQRPALSGLIRCDEDTLYTIASKLERKTGIKAIVTP